MQWRIDLGVARVRLWRDEEPAASYPTTRMLQRYVARSVDRSGAIASTVAIEAWLPVGARSLYGLLGGRFDPGGSATSEIRIAVGSDDGPRLIDTIAGVSDEIRSGLAPEYADAVAEWSARAVDSMSVPVGTLTIDRAAHSLVGSSRNVFSALSVLVVQWLADPFVEGDAIESASMVRDAIMRGADAWLEDVIRARARRAL